MLNPLNRFICEDNPTQIQPFFLVKMSYPEQFEGFLVSSHQDWTTFKKQKVRFCANGCERQTDLLRRSSRQNVLRSMTSTSVSKLVEFAVVMFTR